MKETGTIFSTPMVQALQRGKSVTRRTRGLEEINKEPDRWKFIKKWADENLYIFERDDGSFWRLKCPYGGKGDVLRVKETYCHKVDLITAIVAEDEFWYFASDPEVYKADGDGGMELTKSGYLASPWKSPIFMPKAASRYFLPLTADPIPERVQSITEAEAIAEGITKVGCITADEAKQRGWNAGDLYGLQDWLKYDIFSYTAKDAFARLWDELNQARGYSWKFNPWCWPLRFKPLTGAR